MNESNNTDHIRLNNTKKLLSNITDKDAVDQIMLDNQYQIENSKGKRIY